MFNKHFTLIAILIMALFLGNHKQVFSENPKLPLTVQITHMRLVGDVKSNGMVELEIGYRSNIEGPVTLSLNCPKHIRPSGKEKHLTMKMNLKVGEQNTEKIKLKVWDAESSLIEAIIRSDKEYTGFKNGTSRYIVVEFQDNDYQIYTSIKSDSSYYGNHFGRHKKLHASKGEISKSLLKSTLVSLNYNISISGTVTSIDPNEFRSEGVYNSKVYLWFRNHANPNQLYHPVVGNLEHTHYDNIQANGVFQFTFSATVDLAAYDQIVLLVGTGNNYISYNAPSGYVLTTDQGTLTTFGASEGAVLTFNPNVTNVSIASLDIQINGQDGAILRNMEIAGEFTKQRYNNNLPFSLPLISVSKTELTNIAGHFVYGRTWDFWGFHWDYYQYIEIDPDWTDATTTIHEFGHNVNYCMFGSTYNPMSNTSSQMKEGWAIFYSFGGKNYANNKYGDNLIRWDDNTEEDSYETPRFSGIRYSGNPDYCSFACYLWNNYDSYSDGNFKSIIYNAADNDDVYGYGQRVFETMRQMSEKNPSDFNTTFKNGLNGNLQTSIQRIYDNMFVNSSTRIRSAQMTNVNAVINTSSISFNWASQSYAASNYTNREDNYLLYRQPTVNDPWSLVATIPNTANNYTYNTTYPINYNYKLTSTNTSGDSYNEKLFNYALNASIIGPFLLKEPACGNYTASISGGTGNYTYNWSIRYTGNSWISKGTSNTMYLCPNYNYYFVEIRLVVTSGTQQVSIIKEVDLISKGGPAMVSQSENDLNKSDSIALQLKSITSNYFPDSDTFDYIVLSPNPTKDKLNIKTSSALGRSSIILYNTKGFIVYQNSLNLGIECTIDLSSYPSGVYFLNILSGNKTFIKKIIKQ